MKVKFSTSDYKTIRYKGHCEQMTLLQELGLLGKEQIKLKGGKVVPRELLIHLLDQKLAKDEPDVVLLRVTVTGVKDKEPRTVGLGRHRIFPIKRSACRQ